jgi:hypothetical protein
MAHLEISITMMGRESRAFTYLDGKYTAAADSSGAAAISSLLLKIKKKNPKENHTWSCPQHNLRGTI